MRPDLDAASAAASAANPASARALAGNSGSARADSTALIHRCTRVVHTSTATVYVHTPDGPLDETAPRRKTGFAIRAFDGPPAALRVHPSKIAFMAAKTRVRSDKARRVLGFAPQFDFERGMRLTSAWSTWANLV